jgi:hypothetical protein
MATRITTAKKRATTGQKPQPEAPEKRSRVQRNWTDQEIEAILSYLKGTVLKNEEIEVIA